MAVVVTLIRLPHGLSTDLRHVAVFCHSVDHLAKATLLDPLLVVF